MHNYAPGTHKGIMIRMKHILNLEKRQNLPHYSSDKGFQGTIVNQAFSSLHRVPLRITLTITFKEMFFDRGLEDAKNRKRVCAEMI